MRVEGWALHENTRSYFSLLPPSWTYCGVLHRLWVIGQNRQKQVAQAGNQIEIHEFHQWVTLRTHQIEGRLHVPQEQVQQVIKQEGGEVGG